MPLGGFAPLPLRLGGTGPEGLSAEAHARIAADLVAIVRAAPFALVTYNVVGGVATITAYNGQNGVGLGAAPVALFIANGRVRFTWSPGYEDAYGIGHGVRLRHARVTAHSTVGVLGTATVTAPNVVEARTFLHDGSTQDNAATLSVY